MGTPEYMAPEQALGRHDVDGRLDVYSLGVMTYEAVCGGFPAGQPARSVRPNCPAWLDALIGRMLAEDPAGRPTMAEVRDALRDPV